MNADDFRTGNLCEDVNKNIWHVCMINSQDNRVDTKPMSGSRIDTESLRLFPIKIKEFDLSRLGFFPSTDRVWQHKSKSLSIIISNDKFFVAILDDSGFQHRPYFVGFEFVHELQNVFRDLSGKFLELTN